MYVGIHAHNVCLYMYNICLYMYTYMPMYIRYIYVFIHPPSPFEIPVQVWAPPPAPLSFRPPSSPSAHLPATAPSVRRLRGGGDSKGLKSPKGGSSGHTKKYVYIYNHPKVDRIWGI